MSTRILTQQGTNAAVIQSMVHNIPKQLNALNETGNVLAPIFDIAPANYTIVSQAEVTVVVTVTSSDLPVTDESLQEEKTYIKNQEGVISITVKNDADSSIAAYEVGKIILPADQFAYSSAKSGSNLVYTYTATYNGTYSATEPGSYWYIVKLPESHSWNLDGNTNPLLQKTVVILPWLIKPRESFYAQVNLMQTDILNIITALAGSGYNIPLQNTDIQYFSNFASYLKHLKTILVEKAEHGNNTITVNDNKDIFIGNQYVITNKIVHELVTVDKIESVYDEDNNSIKYKLTLPEGLTLKYDYNIGSSFSPCCYYTSGDAATIGYSYKQLNTTADRHTVKVLTTGVTVMDDAAEKATTLKVSNANGLTVNTTYHLMQDTVDDGAPSFQAVEITKINTTDNTVTINPGLGFEVKSKYTPTFFKTEYTDSFHAIYQTWCNRTDLGNSITCPDKVSSYLLKNKEQPDSLTNEDIAALKEVYWTGITINTTVLQDSTSSINIHLDNSNRVLTPGKTYFVTTIDSTSYGVITVKDFSVTAGATTGTITLKSGATLALTVGGTPSHKFTGTNNNPLYIFEMLPALTLHKCTFWYHSHPQGGTSRGKYTATHTILTKYDITEEDLADTALLGNMNTRVKIYRRIVPFPLSVTHRNMTSSLMLTSSEYASNPLIGDSQFWEESNIIDILGEPTYGYRVEWPTSVQYCYVESGNSNFSGIEGFERFRCAFNSNSSTFLMQESYLYGTLSKFESLPSQITTSLLLSSKGNYDQNYVDMKFYYALNNSKTQHELTYDSSKKGYYLSYEADGNSTTFSNFTISKLTLSETSEQNIESVTTYKHKDYVNWYIDYKNNVIVFPSKTLVYDGETIDVQDLNTEDHPIFVDITYDCEDKEMDAKDNKVDLITKSVASSSSIGVFNLPIEYWITDKYRDPLHNVNINFRLKITAKKYSSIDLTGILTKTDTELTVSNVAAAAEGLKYGSSKNPAAYSDASFNGYIYHAPIHPYIGIRQSIGVGSYAKSKAGILLEDMIDYINKVKEIDDIKGYSIGRGKDFGGVSGVNAGAEALNIDLITPENPIIKILDPSDEDFMRLAFHCDLNAILYSDKPVRVLIRPANVLGDTNNEGGFIDKFIATYCETTSEGHYKLKSREKIIEYYNDPKNQNQRLISYLQTIKEGPKSEQFPPILTCGYLTKSYSFSSNSTTNGNLSYTYYTTDKSPSFKYDFVTQIKGTPTDKAYYSTIGFSSANFANLNLYKSLINNPGSITGSNCRFYKIKLKKTSIDEYAGRYLDVIPENDITEITNVDTNTTNNPTLNENGKFWEENDNIVTIRCSFRMTDPLYTAYGKMDTLALSFSGLFGPRVLGFVNKWIM